MLRYVTRWHARILLACFTTVLAVMVTTSPVAASTLRTAPAKGQHTTHSRKATVTVGHLPKAKHEKPAVKPNYHIPTVPKGPQIPPMRTVGQVPSSKTPAASLNISLHPDTLSGATDSVEELEQFQSAANTGFTPPDNGFSVGPNDIVQFINSSGFIYDRTTAHTQEQSFNLSTFFGAPINPTQIVNVGYSDPRVLYDAISGHWFASILIFDTCSKCSTSNNSEVDVAVSQNADPKGTWNVYPVETTSNNTLLDQPKLGTSDDKVVMTYNENGFGGPYRFVEIQKSDLMALAGSISLTLFGLDSSHYNVIPVISLSSTATEYAVSANRGSSTLTLFSFTGTPDTSPAFTTQDFSIGTVNDPPGAVQQGDARTLDTGTAGVQAAIWQNNTLWAAGNDSCTPPGDSTSRACYRLDQLSTAGFPSLLQDVDVGRTGAYVFYPSVIVDAANNLYVGHSTSSSSLFPTATEAFIGSGAVPSTVPVIDYQTGVGPYDCSFCTAANGDARNRWGDYAAAAQDPNNPKDIWLSEEWGTFDANTNDWADEIARFTAAAPTVTSVAPNHGFDQLSPCGTTVFVTGTDFQLGATVTFGGTPSSSVTVLSPESLSASVPPEAAGTVDVTVTTPNGTSATSSADHFTYIADTTPPVTTATYSGANGAGWNNSNFTINFSALDEVCGSGVKNITVSASSSDGGFTLPPTVYPGNTAAVLVGTEGISTITYYATDNAGNVETPNTLTVRLDKTPPTIAISSPTATTNLLNQVVPAGYTCTDTLSGVKTCTGTVPNGSPIDTASLGAHTFTVNASDVADNTSSQSVVYTVAYKICLLYNPAQPVHTNQIPIKLEICDANNINLSSAAIVLTAVSVSPTGSVTSSSNPGNLFRFDPTVAPGGGYLYNLHIKGLPAGSYTLNFTVAGDPTTHQAPFTIG